MDDLKEAFANARSIADIFKVKKELTSKGADVKEVNMIASQRRRELIQSVNSVCTLEKVIPNASTVNPLKVSSLPIEYEHIESGVIEVFADGHIVI